MFSVTPAREFNGAVTNASYCDITLRMLFLSFSFPEILEIAMKSDIVILVLTDDTDGTELPTFRLLDSDGASYTLLVNVDHRSAILLVSPSSVGDLSSSSFNLAMLLSLTSDCCCGELLTMW